MMTISSTQVISLVMLSLPPLHLFLHKPTVLVEDTAQAMRPEMLDHIGQELILAHVKVGRRTVAGLNQKS